MRKTLTIFTEIAESEGITITALEKSIGASKGVLSRALRAGTDIQSKWLISLVDNYPQYNPTWILTGKGEKLLLEDKKQQISTSESVGIPFYDIDVTAGNQTFEELTQNENPASYINIPGLNADYVLPVTGDSMYPEISGGDLIAVKEVSSFDVWVEFGRKYLLVTTDDRRMVKYVQKSEDAQRWTLRSCNPNYEPFEIPISFIRKLFIVVQILKREML